MNCVKSELALSSVTLHEILDIINSHINVSELELVDGNYVLKLKVDKPFLQ